ncbi:hypothetical protein [Lentzea flaviverrucosa]|uniref:Uncharacterized protein n=1 Tax=Lentzea flaviverrucosa TaxID=200379 RepID=A0A1H9SGP5_9PSEU|nr:hypothetical protein [Lentzea flaviverrucosa]RDI25364.1 hypothetical protein DFR72_10856 [Lentzea flaviverrucosa]SER84134.1 hypothetical protein SAMN05216195_10757 [Lentzea flaviverrucosa]
MTGEQLFAHVVERAGWEFGGAHSGHLINQFPYETIDSAKIASYIAPGRDQPMRRTGRNGQVCHWFLEIHQVDRERQIGRFYEELPDLGHQQSCCSAYRPVLG